MKFKWLLDRPNLSVLVLVLVNPVKNSDIIIQSMKGNQTAHIHTALLIQPFDATSHYPRMKTFLPRPQTTHL